MADQDGIRNPMEIYSSFHGKDWSPQRAAFHQNLEQFADRIGLIDSVIDKRPVQAVE